MENTINEHKEVNATRKADDDARVEDLIDVRLKFQEQGGDSEVSLTKDIKVVILVSMYIYIYIYTTTTRNLGIGEVFFSDVFKFATISDIL